MRPPPPTTPARRANVADIFTVFQAITELARPVNIQPRSLQTTPPDPEQLALGGAESARAIARSATAIAHATAALGADPVADVVHAKVLWEENLKQIARVQVLYNLPPLPFQSPPATS